MQRVHFIDSDINPRFNSKKDELAHHLMILLSNEHMKSKDQNPSKQEDEEYKRSIKAFQIRI